MLVKNVLETLLHRWRSRRNWNPEERGGTKDVREARNSPRLPYPGQTYSTAPNPPTVPMRFWPAKQNAQKAIPQRSQRVVWQHYRALDLDDGWPLAMAVQTTQEVRSCNMQVIAQSRASNTGNQRRNCPVLTK